MGLLDSLQLPLPQNYSKLSPPLRAEVREHYIKRQKGICIHCGNPLSQEPSEDIQNLKINRKLFPADFFNYPIHLHHDHITDLTLGAVHARCNAVLWQYHNE